MLAQKPYKVKFNFTMGFQESLRAGVYTVEAGKRLIKAELGLHPSCENPDGDVRYEVDAPEQFIELLKLAFTISNGGWVRIEPMPEGVSVFLLPTRVDSDRPSAIVPIVTELDTENPVHVFMLPQGL